MSLQAKVKSMMPESLSLRKKTLSLKRSAWITPSGKLFGQTPLERWSSSAARNARKHGCTSSARPEAASNSGRQPETESALAQLIAKLAPARCIFASASPTPAQCVAFAVLGEMRHQREEVRQIVLRHALLIEREDERARGGMQQEVGVFDALGDALVGEQFAEIVLLQ